jgi:MFS family permease
MSERTDQKLEQLGWGCLLLQPIALAYGRRGVYLFSTLLNVPIMIWTANSSSPGEWYAHRIIIGIVNAPIESLPEISVADLMFAHERGTWMAAYVLVLFESNFIAPLIAGWLNDAIGWRWTMKFGAIVAAVSFLILFFFMEETMYFRHTTEGEQPATHRGEVTDVNTAPPSPEKPQVPTAVFGDYDDSTTEKSVASRTFASKIMPFRKLSGRPSVKQMFFMMIRPLLIIIKFPNVAWAGFIYGINLSWYQVLNGTASPVLSAPPYEWRSAFIGCIYVGPMVGAVFGCLWAGIAADKLALYLARRNGGVREPEHRLWPLAIAGIFTAAGLITWVSEKPSSLNGVIIVLTMS